MGLEPEATRQYEVLRNRSVVIDVAHGPTAVQVLFCDLADVVR